MAETFEEAAQLFVHHGVVFYRVHEFGFRGGVGQLAIEQQIAKFQII